MERAPYNFRLRTSLEKKGRQKLVPVGSTIKTYIRTGARASFNGPAAKAKNSKKVWLTNSSSGFSLSSGVQPLAVGWTPSCSTPLRDDNPVGIKATAKQKDAVEPKRPSHDHPKTTTKVGVISQKSWLHVKLVEVRIVIGFYRYHRASSPMWHLVQFYYIINSTW